MNHPDRDPATLAADAAACRRLWADVLLLALADADRGDALAIAWFGAPDFLTVAALAGLDPDAARDRLRPRAA